MVIEGFRYSPGGDQGVMTVCVALFWAALALLAVPAVMIVIWFTGELHRDLRRAGLSAGQAALVEAGAMGVAGYEWSKYNREWSGRLTDSVMGPERTGTWPDGR
jgi:hypothetical protein